MLSKADRELIVDAVNSAGAAEELGALDAIGPAEVERLTALCDAGPPGDLTVGGEDGDYTITDSTGREVGTGYDRGAALLFAEAGAVIRRLLLALGASERIAAMHRATHARELAATRAAVTRWDAARRVLTAAELAALDALPDAERAVAIARAAEGEATRSEELREWNRRATEAEDTVCELRAEVARYKAREEHFASALAVADGGQYRTDWDGALTRLLRERAEARETIEGRTTPPTPAEAAALCLAGGTWRWSGWRDGVLVPGYCGESAYPPPSAITGPRRVGARYTERWWAHDASRAPTAWPKAEARHEGGGGE